MVVRPFLEIRRRLYQIITFVMLMLLILFLSRKIIGIETMCGSVPIYLDRIQKQTYLGCSFNKPSKDKLYRVSNFS